MDEKKIKVLIHIQYIYKFEVQIFLPDVDPQLATKFVSTVQGVLDKFSFEVEIDETPATDVKCEKWRLWPKEVSFCGFAYLGIP